LVFVEEQERQFTYKVTLGGFRATVVVEKQ